MQTPLIPRKVLFGNPEKENAKMSPDGSYISWLAPKNGILTLWLATPDNIEKPSCLVCNVSQPIHSYVWSKDSQYLLYMQDIQGDENWQIYTIHINSKKIINLTDTKGVNAEILKMSWNHPEHILIKMNNRDSQWHDVYKVNITNGEKECIFLNDREFSHLIFDDNYEVKFAERMLDIDNTRIFYLFKGNRWKEFKRIKSDDSMNTHISHLESCGKYLYMFDASAYDTNALVRIDIENETQILVAHTDESDIWDLLIHPVSYKVEAWASNYLKQKWHTLSSSVEEEMVFLRKHFLESYTIVSRTKDDKYWIITTNDACNPREAWLYDREGKILTKIYDSRPAIDKNMLLPMHTVSIEARDGLILPSYLTLPQNIIFDSNMKLSKAVSMVLLVHGGPWGRDYYGYNPIHQWLANRGYAVLSVNFRGSTGFGKDFVNKGDREWSGKMHDDLIDAVNWSISQGIAPKEKIAIMGRSYGGYATLVGLSYTPEVFCCGVDLVGPSNLETLLKTIPSYWKSFLNDMIHRIGNPFSPEGIAFLKSCSPLYRADAITKPLLIGQGANDPRVKEAEAKQMVNAMKANNLPVIYVLYPDEGHNLRNPENLLSFYALTENFLALHLEGKAEPIEDAFEKSSMEMIEGKKIVERISSSQTIKGLQA